MSGRRYAEDTKVTVDKSKSELEQVLRRYGAGEFGYGWKDNKVGIRFEMQGRRYLFRVAMPSPSARDFTHTPQGSRRSEAQAQTAIDQAERRLWRALILVVKAKLEAVTSGLETFEQAFMANLMLPDGRTMHEWAEPQIEEVYATNTMPALMPGLDDREEEGQFRILPMGGPR